MTYQNSKLDWNSSSINVSFWPYRMQPLERVEYDAMQTKRKAAATARTAAQAIAKTKNPETPTLEPKKEPVAADAEAVADDAAFEPSDEGEWESF